MVLLYIVILISLTTLYQINIQISIYFGGIMFNFIKSFFSCFIFI